MIPIEFLSMEWELKWNDTGVTLILHTWEESNECSYSSVEIKGLAVYFKSEPSNCFSCACWACERVDEILQHGEFSDPNTGKIVYSVNELYLM